MMLDPDITAKITFTANNAQFINSGIKFMPVEKWLVNNSNVQQNNWAMDTNSYIALLNPTTMHFAAPNKPYKA